jgi:hypothetical protein
MTNTPYEIVTAVYTIAASKLPRISALIDKLNKRCRRLQIPELTLKITGTETKKFTRKHYGGVIEHYEVIFHTVEFTGGRPKLGGWEFAGTLEHDLETGLTILRTSEAFGRELPLKFRKAEPICQHCGLKRTRRDTYIVYNAEQDVYKQVGHQCVADFLGLQDVHRALDIAQVWYDLDSICDGDAEDDGCEGWSGFKKDTAMSLIEFLSRAVATVRVFGFVSRKAQQELNDKLDRGELHENAIIPQITSVRVMNYLFPERKNLRDKYGNPTKLAEEIEATKPTEADIKHSEELIEWAQSFDRDQCNDYQFNLLAATANEIMPFRRSGIVASLPAAWNKHMQILDERQKKAAEWAAKNAERIANCKHVGTVGERLRNLKLKVVRVIPREGQYGVTYITALEDQDGNQFTWFASGLELTAGESYTVTGTVKSHGDFKGIAQTVLTRCKVHLECDRCHKMTRELGSYEEKDGFCKKCYKADQEARKTATAA